MLKSTTKIGDTKTWDSFGVEHRLPDGTVVGFEGYSIADCKRICNQQRRSAKKNGETGHRWRWVKRSVTVHTDLVGPWR